MQHAPIAGRYYAVGAGVGVLVVPLPSSLPIPLGVTAPAGIALLTWAFAGLAADDPTGPRALLVIASGEGDLPGELMLATHYRDVTVSLGDPASAEPPAPCDLAVLTRAILSAGSPAMIPHLAALVGWVGQNSDVFVADADAPVLTIQGDAVCTLGGTAVPNHLLLRGAGNWALMRNASATLSFGETPFAALGLAPVWGAHTGAAPDTAIGLHANGFTAYRIGPPR